MGRLMTRVLACAGTAFHYYRREDQSGHEDGPVPVEGHVMPRLLAGLLSCTCAFPAASALNRAALGVLLYSFRILSVAFLD